MFIMILGLTLPFVTFLPLDGVIQLVLPRTFSFDELASLGPRRRKILKRFQDEERGNGDGGIQVRRANVFLVIS